MSESIRYAGLDVSKAEIAVAIAEPDGSVVEHGTIANDPGAVRRLVEQLSRDAVVHTAYEAGPTGYPLHRQLVSLGVTSRVVAPSLIPSVRATGSRLIAVTRSIWPGCCAAAISRRSGCRTRPMRRFVIWCVLARTLEQMVSEPSTTSASSCCASGSPRRRRWGVLGRPSTRRG